MVSKAIKSPKRATNLTLDAQAIQDAKELGINISSACEKGLVAEIAKARGEKWLRENREAIDSFNAYVDKHGIPLSEYRQF